LSLYLAKEEYDNLKTTQKQVKWNKNHNKFLCSQDPYKAIFFFFSTTYFKFGCGFPFGFFSISIIYWIKFSAQPPTWKARLWFQGTLP